MKPKISTNNLMKNFMPVADQEVPVNNNTISDAAPLPTDLPPAKPIQDDNPPAIIVIPSEEKKLKVKEKQIPITFNIPSPLNDRLITHVYKRKLEGMKITKTEVIAAAIEKYLNETEL